MGYKQDCGEHNKQSKNEFGDVIDMVKKNYM